VCGTEGCRAQEIERGLVRPVDVLEHGQRGAQTARELRENALQDPVPRLARVLEEPLERPADRAPDVEDRSQGSGRRQGVAGSDEHPRGLPGRVCDAVDERRLADARLASHEHETTVPASRLAEQAVELRQEVLALQ
jgi:hypothetical protein